MKNKLLNLKRIVTISALMLTGVIVAGSISTDNASAASKKDSSLVRLDEKKPEEVSAKEILILEQGAVSSTKNQLLNDIQKNIAAWKTTFRVSYSGSANSIPSLTTIYKYIASKDNKKTSDDSDFVHGAILDIGYSAHYSGNTIVLDFKLKYTETADKVKKINQKVKSILKKLKVNGMSDAAKVKVIHDYVCKNVSYDNTLKDHSAYGGLVDGKHTTVCQGYSLIMYKLLTEAGVDAHYVGGKAAGGPHAWNLVKVNGKWYCLDATWDDPDDQLSYDYFLKGSKTFNKDHKLDKEYKGYKIASGNLDWKKAIKKSNKKSDGKVSTTQSDKEIKSSQKAGKRAKAARMIADVIDETIQYDDNSDIEIAMYDLYKKIYGYILYEVSDEAFEAIFNDDTVMNMYVSSTAKLIMDYIVNPTVTYISSDEFTSSAIEGLYYDFTAEDFYGLSDDEFDDLLNVYCYELFSEVFYAYSEQYTDYIVDVMVETLDASV